MDRRRPAGLRDFPQSFRTARSDDPEPRGDETPALVAPGLRVHRFAMPRNDGN